MNPPTPIATFTVDKLRVQIHKSRDEAGYAAAVEVAREIQAYQAKDQSASIIFAAAPSQNEFLAYLAQQPAIHWSRVTAFHMDEYLGLTADDPGSFRHYLANHLFHRVDLRRDQLRLILGECVENPTQVCLDYETLLKANPPQIVCGGIGENGHLAFNDPPADFEDPTLVKVVRLDEACRQQQANDGCFPNIKSVPKHAFTLTIPALLRAPTLSIVVPGLKKAKAVRLALKGTISDLCPASILRTHPNANLYLDLDSGSLLN